MLLNMVLSGLCAAHLLIARMKQLDTYIDTASEITWAFAHIA